MQLPLIPLYTCRSDNRGPFNKCGCHNDNNDGGVRATPSYGEKQCCLLGHCYFFFVQKYATKRITSMAAIQMNVIASGDITVKI